MEQSPFIVLIDDHKRIAGLMKKLETEGKDLRTRELLMDELWNELDRHSQLEQNTLYPVLEEKETLRDLALEFEREHEWLLEQMELLDSLEPQDIRWFSEFSALRENFELHVSEEEGSLFAHMKQAFTPLEIQAIEKDLAQAKEDQAA